MRTLLRPSALRRAARNPAALRRAGATLTLVLALLAAIAGGTDRGAAQPAAIPDENSWLRVQNVGTNPATVNLTFYGRDGSVAGRDACPQAGACEAISPGSGRTFFQQTLSSLPKGYRGSAYLVSDQPFVAMLARDLIRPDGSFQIGGDSLRLGGGVSRLYLPWVTNGAQYASRIVVENTAESTPACVQIVYHAAGSLSPAVTDPSGGTAGCPNGGTLLAPRATLQRDETNLPVPFGFEGSAYVRTQTTGAGIAAGQQQLAVMVDTRDRLRAGLASSRAIGEDEASRVVLLPMVDRNAREAGGTFTTRFRIMSATPSVPNEVSIRFEGRDGSGNQVSIDHKVTVLGALTCDQSVAFSSGCLPGDRDLPATFTGSVRLQSVEPIAVVVQRLSTNGSIADYRGFTAAEASRQVVLPVVNKNYQPFGGRSGWNSSFRVASFDGSTASVYLVYYSKQFPRGLFPSGWESVVGQRTFKQADDRGLPDNWVGSAVVISDRPVVVVASLASDVFEGDAVMLYNGISLE